MFRLAVADSGAGAVGGLILILIAGLLYFLPAIVANNRRATPRGTVTVINLFLGWTVVGLGSVFGDGVWPNRAKGRIANEGAVRP